MKTSYDYELINVILPAISNGSILVEDSSAAYFSTLAVAFPLSGSRIDWCAVPESIEGVASSDKELDSFIGFFDRIRATFDDRDVLTYVGDGLTNCAYTGTFEVLRDHLADFMSIPQHHYFIGAECKWCMSFMFEGDMAFGRAPRLNQAF